MCVLYQHALPSALWWVKKNWKEKELWVALSFYAITFSMWVTKQGSNTREDTIGFPGFLYFVGHYGFPPTFETNSGLNRKCGLLGLLEYPVFYLGYSVLDVTCLLCTCFGFCWTPMYHGFTKILYPWGISNTIWKQAAKNSGSYTYLLCSNACFLGPSDFMYEIQVQR